MKHAGLMRELAQLDANILADLQAVDVATVIGELQAIDFTVPVIDVAGIMAELAALDI